MNTIFRLAWEIHRHRHTMLTQGIAPDEHDVALWRSLDQINVATTDGPISVATFLDDITSRPGFIPPDDRAADSAA